MRRKQSSAVFPVIAVTMIGVFLVLVYFSFFGPDPTLSMGLVRFDVPTATPTPFTFEAEQVVKKMYDALASNDDVAYLGTLSVVSRGKIRPERVLSSFLDHSRIELYGLQFTLDHVDDISFDEMTYRGERQHNDYVLVVAQGQAYLAALKAEYPLCQKWDVHRYAEGWLVDPDAPERNARIQNLDAQRLKGSGFDGLPQWLAKPLQQFATSPEDNIRRLMNTCE